ncbi:MAG: hypothetical protein RI580_00630 [Halothece sp. Uz-M2-17]|nr:hypothetical protein [Halothece sp. Uz-M2-17]
MTDHQTSYTINSMIGRLYLKNKAFQSLELGEQQSIVLDLLEASYLSDVNIGEILSNECFLSDRETDEKRTLASIFQICSCCGKVKDSVTDYHEGFFPQGLCADCAT